MLLCLGSCLRSLLEIPGKWKFQEDFVAMFDFFKNLSIRNHHQKSELISDDLCIFVCMFGFKWCVHLQSSGVFEVFRCSDQRRDEWKKSSAGHRGCQGQLAAFLEQQKSKYHLSSVQNLGWLGYIGGYTTQLYRDYSKPI